MNALNSLLSRTSRRAPVRLREHERGVSMVEFMLVLPIFLVLTIGLMEFAVAFNAMLGVNFASREAALIAAESGTESIADCRVLQRIEDSITSPADAGRITQVRVYRAGVNGNELAANVYARGGSTTCQFWDGVETQDITVQYTLVSGGYQPATRCTSLEGCSGQPLDTIGVEISYQHSWVTPLAGMLTFTGTSIDVTRANAMRMEPVL